MNLYEVLELKENAGDEEIRKAYRRLAKKFHPDSHPGDLEKERKFKQIVKAYAVLNNPEERKKYDAGLYMKKGADNRTAYQASPPDFGTMFKGKNPIDTTDMFDAFMKMK